MFSNDGYIAREEMMALLQNCLNLSGQEEEGEDGIKVSFCCIWIYWLWVTWLDLVQFNSKSSELWSQGRSMPFPKIYPSRAQDLIDMTLKKMDIDKDGRICYEDFETTVGQISPYF